MCSLWFHDLTSCRFMFQSRRTSTLHHVNPWNILGGHVKYLKFAFNKFLSNKNYYEQIQSYFNINKHFLKWWKGWFWNTWTLKYLSVWKLQSQTRFASINNHQRIKVPHAPILTQKWILYVSHDLCQLFADSHSLELLLAGMINFQIHIPPLFSEAKIF